MDWGRGHEEVGDGFRRRNGQDSGSFELHEGRDWVCLGHCCVLRACSGLGPRKYLICVCVWGCVYGDVCGKIYIT